VKARTAVLVGLAIASLALTMGCDEPVPPTAPTIPNITNVNINNIGTQPGPNPSPSPGTGQCVREAIDSVRVNPFGYQNCPTAPPNNSSGLLPFGCTARVTATPKDRAGVDVPASLHGTQITWSVAIGADRIVVTDDPEQPFNKNVRMRDGSAPGEFRLEATVCTVTGAWNGRTTP